MTEPRRVLIADDHPPTRAGIRITLEGAGFAICAEVGDAPRAIEESLSHRPDVCLLDVHMPGSGIAAAKAIASELPHTAIVMLTVSRDDDDLFASLQAGAAGYLLKDTDPDALPGALNSVLEGEAALPGALVARLVEEFRSRPKRRRLGPNLGDNLTNREWQVLELMQGGMGTEQIANRLVISKATVRSHVASILRKLRVPDRATAIRLLDGNG